MTNQSELCFAIAINERSHAFMPKRPFLKFLSFYENDADAARAIGVSRNTINLWKNGKNRVTAERAKQFEELTNGFVTRNEFRPELFGEQKKTVNPESIC